MNYLDYEGLKRYNELLHKEIQTIEGKLTYPNLSTQLSILPYKFGNKNIYEILCPYINDDFDTSQIPTDAKIIGGSIFNDDYCEALNCHWETVNGTRTLYITNIVNEFIPDYALIKFYSNQIQ